MDNFKSDKENIKMDTNVKIETYKPPVVVQHPPEDTKLLSIDEYKGKSIEELEAILDAHNKRRSEPEPSNSNKEAPAQQNVIEKR